MRAYLVCADCTNHVGNDHDPAFITFWARPWNLLVVEGTLPVIGAWARVQLENAPMSAVLRSAVAGFLGMNPEIGVTFPALPESVRDGVPATLPQGVQLLFGYYGGPDRWVHNGAFTPRLGPELELTVSYGMLAWPPFFLVITDDSGLRQWPGCPDLLPTLEWETIEPPTVHIQAPRVQVDHPMRPVGAAAE